MHPLLSPLYEAIARSATLLTSFPIRGEHKLLRTFRERRDALARLVDWGTHHRDPARPLLWMHAPSVGEGLMAEPVLRAIRTARPECQLLYTYFSPSAARFANGLPVDFVAPLPFDSTRAATALLDALRPSALVVSKLDLWPRLTELAHARGVRLGMISATLSEGSGRSGRFARALLHDAYAALDAVGAVDPTDADRLVRLGVAAPRIHITGDTRYDQVVARARACDRQGPLLAPLASSRPTLVAGSTWPADERVLLPAWRALRAAVPEARLIIAPHEPTEAHCAPIARWAAESGMSWCTIDAARGDHDVVIVNRVGVLGDLYALGQVGFVGGGFHAAGLHSVLEPAAFAMPVLFGPRHQMSRDARLLLERRAGESVQNEHDLVHALQILFTEPDTRERAGQSAAAVVKDGVGAAARSVDLVLQLLTKD